MLTLDQRYYLDSKKERAMSQEELDSQETQPGDENHFEPAFLLGGPGTLISEADAEKLGISGSLEEHNLAENKAVMRTVNALPNRADLNVAQVLPEDRTALQKAADAVNESENADTGLSEDRAALGLMQPARETRAARRTTRATEERREGEGEQAQS